MNFKQLRQKKALLFLWALITQTAHNTELNLEFIKKTNSIAKIPAVQLDWIIRSAQSVAQTAPVQDAVAQIVENTSSNFESLDNRGRYKLLKSYKQLLTSPLLRDDQKAYLRDTVIPRVTPLVQPLDTNQASAADLETQQLLSTLATKQNTDIPVAQGIQAVVQATNQIPVAALTSNVLPSMAPSTTTATVAPTTTATVAPTTTATVAITGMPISQATSPTASPIATTTSQVIQTATSQPAVAAATTTGLVGSPVTTAAVTAAPLATQAIQNSTPSTTIVAPTPLTTATSTTLTTATPTTLNAATITAITQNTQLSTAAKAAALTNLINTAPTSTPADMQAAGIIAQSIQDLYNVQTPADAKAISDLLQATLQKPLLTPEQKNYITTTLVPGITQQLATVAPISSSANAGQIIQNATTSIAAQQPVITTLAPASTLVNTPPLTPAFQPASTAVTQLAAPVAASGITEQVVQNATNYVAAEQPVASNFAATAIPTANKVTTNINMPTANFTQTTQSDIESIIKTLYAQMQTAQGNTYDAQTQGAFGTSLVEAFNQIVELQSYMSQLLIAAEDTPLLNEAQQQYVRDVMMPNLDQVSSTTPTKKLDDAIATDAAKKDKSGKRANTDKKKKVKKAAKAETAKKAKKKLKKAKPEKTIIPNSATPNAKSPDKSAANKTTGKKKIKKKGTKVKTGTANSPTQELTIQGGTNV
jgi:hypothetical protein